MVEMSTNTMVVQQDNVGAVYVRLHTDITHTFHESSNSQHSTKLLDIRYHLFFDFAAAPTVGDAYLVIQSYHRQYSALMAGSIYPDDIANIEH